jgi:hypothetical protein
LGLSDAAVTKIATSTHTITGIIVIRGRPLAAESKPFAPVQSAKALFAIVMTIPLVLLMVSDYITGPGPEHAANGRACARRTRGGSD